MAADNHTRRRKQIVVGDFVDLRVGVLSVNLLLDEGVHLCRNGDVKRNLVAMRHNLKREQVAASKEPRFEALLRFQTADGREDGFHRADQFLNLLLRLVLLRLFRRKRFWHADHQHLQIETRSRRRPFSQIPTDQQQHNHDRKCQTDQRVQDDENRMRQNRNHIQRRRRLDGFGEVELEDGKKRQHEIRL